MTDEDYLGLSAFSLDDAMITYTDVYNARVYREGGWSQFKRFYNCPQTPAELFDRFWDVIMPKLKDYEIVQKKPWIARNLSSIYNPRKYPPQPRKVYGHVSEMSLGQYQKKKYEEMQRQMLNDPKMVALKEHALNFISRIRLERPNRESQGATSLPRVDQSILLETTHDVAHDSSERTSEDESEILPKRLNADGE